MSRLIFLCFIAAALALAIFLGCYYLHAYGDDVANAVVRNKFTEFDFAAYAFGIVAVAVTFSGVYVSLVPERCCDQLIKLLHLHMIPDPFSDARSMFDVCHPTSPCNGAERSAAVKCIHALDVLQRWVTLDKAQRAKMLGTDGLDADGSWLGRAFLVLQNQTDREVVAVLGVSVSIIYAVLVPVAYYFYSAKFVLSVLITVYVFCVLDIALCALLFMLRSRFFSTFEKRMTPWKSEIKNFLLVVVGPAPATTSSSVVANTPQNPG